MKLGNSLPVCGIYFLLQDDTQIAQLRGRNVALLTNQSAITPSYVPSAYALFDKLGHALKCILTPEHGWSSSVAEGVKIGDGTDPYLQMPIISLYAHNKNYLNFLKEAQINTIIIDLQDMGLSCYTYTATCAQLIEDLTGVEFIICDRPNPLGPHVQGFNRDLKFQTLLSYLDVPFQHGKTIGQLLLDHAHKILVDLKVIECEKYHKPYQYPWIPPSPNLPSWDAALLYPGLVLLEGTNVSEGRGTNLPFTSIGAPGLNGYQLAQFINIHESGIKARPVYFTPQSGKLAGKECCGVHILIEDHTKLKALDLGIDIIKFLKQNYDGFEWIKTPSSEMFIDYLMGTPEFRKAI